MISDEGSLTIRSYLLPPPLRPTFSVDPIFRASLRSGGLRTHLHSSDSRVSASALIRVINQMKTPGPSPHEGEWARPPPSTGAEHLAWERGWKGRPILVVTRG